VLGAGCIHCFLSAKLAVSVKWSDFGKPPKFCWDFSDFRYGRTAELRQVQQLSLVLTILKPIGCQLISSSSCRSRYVSYVTAANMIASGSRCRANLTYTVFSRTIICAAGEGQFQYLRIC
jgi:hypothetical protein